MASFAEHQRQLTDVLKRTIGGVVRFSCSAARALSFQVHAEIDDEYPDNVAHAHVYDDGEDPTRKKRARSLATQCHVVVEPRFDELSSE